MMPYESLLQINVPSGDRATDQPREGRKRKYHARRFDGCSSCKSKRLGCDRQKPSCGRCQRLSVRCLYPPNMTVFKPHDVQAASSKSVSGPAARKLESLVENPAGPNSIKSLICSGFRDQLTSTLYESFYPKVEPLYPISDLQWYEAVFLHANKGPALTQMLTALALRRVAFLNSDPVADLEGQRAYVKALGAVQAALSSNRDLPTEETMAAVRTAHLYETLFPSDKGISAEAHWRGLKRLIAHERPQDFGRLGDATLRTAIHRQTRDLMTDADHDSNNATIYRRLQQLRRHIRADCIRLERLDDMSPLFEVGHRIRQVERNYLMGVLPQQQTMVNLGQYILKTEQSLRTWVLARLGIAKDVDSGFLQPFSLADPYTETFEITPMSYHCALKVGNFCFFELYVLDMASKLRDLVGLDFNTPGLTPYLDPSYRAALALRIIRISKQMLGSPREICMAMHLTMPFRIAHETLSSCAPEKVHESLDVLQQHLKVGNGLIMHDRDITDVEKNPYQGCRLLEHLHMKVALQVALYGPLPSRDAHMKPIHPGYVV